MHVRAILDLGGGDMIRPIRKAVDAFAKSIATTS
jgi:hypothetical protein